MIYPELSPEGNVLNDTYVAAMMCVTSWGGVEAHNVEYN